MNSTQKSQVDFNIAIHDRIAKRYEKDHIEIFNEYEQKRLAESLKTAAGLIDSDSSPTKALDLGCGSGNVTSHLLSLNFHVTAADISENFLQLVTFRYGCEKLETLKLSGRDLSNIQNNSYDLITFYSVLHHVPDYLAVLRETASKCKNGGLIYIDHENNDEYWANTPTYQAFKKEVTTVNWRKFLRPMNYVYKFRRIMNPRYTNEGDIHVWPDDHIEWTKISTMFAREFNFEVVMCKDYLLCNKSYNPEIFDRYKDRCSDCRIMAFRKLK